jgi:mitotic spindle assembly checkpoint protein MAD1
MNLSFDYCLSTTITDTERKKYVDQFLYSEQELAAAKGREKALQDQLLKEVTDSQERLRKHIQLNSEVQVLLFYHSC